MDDVSPFDYLSFISTIIICLTFSVVYVLGLYVLSPSLHRYQRNHPNVICRRFVAVLIVCSLVYLFLKHTSNSNININTWLGFRRNIASKWILFFYPTLLTLLLYLGPIIQWIDLFDWRYYSHNWNHILPFQDTHEQLIFIRNYLVAPFTEEFVFRSSILCLLYSHVSLFSAIFYSPLFFGLAHFHHMLEHFKQNHNEKGHRLSAINIILIHLFQFSYTYIFGVYSSFLFIRTGHFIPSFIIHTLCNSLGIPDFMNLIDLNDGHRKRKIIYMICYIIGLWLFSTNLYALTQSNFYYSNDSSIIIYRHWSS
ncbi:unnamed protein product [Rotaria magnacalcarata]|uniref:CAAX prenyl protease 2 n=4 Tax=Rotaria magnacalcarata TaxID=392030 RepID=A0A816T017_9BILA|nr:unnamed protein product [Rotaria magnacalcarata]CAF1520353.1 unnamed protein product [Rotaria magnacalcarata]CAF2091557.1 unnamed protein product [Rotaria magnacalcarata]CAF2201194.1 unnamed protein product [Rotaria magnacalcarata]CAF3745902.1 unnamed protein product [Rotaria magnacalcarata]